MAGKEISGILDFGRTLERRLKKIAELGKGIDRDTEGQEGKHADLAEECAVNHAKDHAANEARNGALGTLVGAHARPEFVASVAGTDEVGAGVGNGHGCDDEDEAHVGKIGAAEERRRDQP